jgi:hypothetical protein
MKILLIGLSDILFILEEAHAGAFPLDLGAVSWDAFGLDKMELSFAVEAKSFSFLVNEGKSEVHMEKRRNGFSGSISLSLLCSDWLADMVEEALLSQGTEVFAKYFREDSKVLRVHKGCNKAGRFLKAAVFAEGGRKGCIWLPEGREGWGCRQFVVEL